MTPIRNKVYRITKKDNFTGSIVTFETIAKNEREINKYMKQTDGTLISAEVIGEGAIIGFK